MEQNTNNQNNMALEIEKKMKEYTKILFNQLKFGCYRQYCYNPYCVKNNKDYKKLSDKELILEALKLAKQKSCEQYVCVEARNNEISNKDSIEHDVERFIQKFSNDQLTLDLDFNKMRNHFLEGNEKIESSLKGLNRCFDTFIQNVPSDVKVKESFFIYLRILSLKSLIYLFLHPDFFLTETLMNEYTRFFTNFLEIKSQAKKFTKEGVEDFISLHKSKEDFLTIVANCQNFLTLLLFNAGNAEEDEEMPDQATYNLLTIFVKTFKTLYTINEKLKIISYKEFYNESISKYLNLKYECKIYSKILDNAYDGKKPFCLLSYHWLLDASAKSDVLYIFNYHKQRTEMISNLTSLTSSLPLGGLFLYLQVNRNNIIEDTLNFMSSPSINFKMPLKVKFIGEQGIDEGGVKKEFFLLLVRQLFDPNYGMFTYNEKNRLFWFNPHSFEPRIKFELIGTILGLAFFNNVILDIKFPSVVYKKLLNVKPTLADIKEIDPELYTNFLFLLNTKEKNLKEALCTTFTVIVDKFGEKEIIPLKLDGENTWIDESNREEYVELYMDWLFNKSIEYVFEAFKAGFYRVCEHKLFHMLRPEELELIICGTQMLNFKELEKVARYDDGYEKDSITIKHLWEVVHELSEEERKKFLFFLTGCDRAPINGLGSLIITISRFGPDSDKLPCAHTCFNHMLLPDYQNKEKLRNRLIIAINNSEGFGLM